MTYDRHLELESKWSKASWARGYHVATIGDITEEAIKNISGNNMKDRRKKIGLLLCGIK